MSLLGPSVLGLLSAASLIVGQNTSNSVVSIPYEYTYLLPNGFMGNVNETFVNGTSTDNSTINSLLQTANRAPFIAYDNAFLDIIGPNPQPRLIDNRSTLFAYEAGVWIPERNEVWYTTSVSQAAHIPSYIEVLNLDTNSIYRLNGTSQPIINPNGAYYFQGKVYFATYPSNQTYPANGTHRGDITSVDVDTLKVETILNSYFGLPFNGPDDLVWTQQGNSRYLFFTDLFFDYLAYPNPPTPQLPAGVWRWDPQTHTLLPVISRNEIDPNGIRVSPDMKTLYVTDSSSLFGAQNAYKPPVGPAAENWLGPYIYKYNLDDEMMPVNRRVFGLVREGLADGLHVDDEGNVWTGESEGIVVRNCKGSVLGVFNAGFFQGEAAREAGVPIANFALAGDMLVVLGVSALWTVKLGKVVVGAGSSIVN